MYTKKKRVRKCFDKDQQREYCQFLHQQAAQGWRLYKEGWIFYHFEPCQQQTLYFRLEVPPDAFAPAWDNTGWEIYTVESNSLSDLDAAGELRLYQSKQPMSLEEQLARDQWQYQRLGKALRNQWWSMLVNVFLVFVLAFIWSPEFYMVFLQPKTLLVLAALPLMFLISAVKAYKLGRQKKQALSYLQRQEVYPAGLLVDQQHRHVVCSDILTVALLIGLLWVYNGGKEEQSSFLVSITEGPPAVAEDLRCYQTRNDWMAQQIYLGKSSFMREALADAQDAVIGDESGYFDQWFRTPFGNFYARRGAMVYTGVLPETLTPAEGAPYVAAWLENRAHSV